jgi:hypothetical protein
MLMVVLLGALGACKGGDATASAERCAQLAKACGEQDKHVEKIVEACTQAAKQHADKGCADPLAALHACYEKQLCGGTDKVWALDDLRVLAERHDKCAAERAAVRACGDK